MKKIEIMKKLKELLRCEFEVFYIREWNGEDVSLESGYFSIHLSDTFHSEFCTLEVQNFEVTYINGSFFTSNLEKINKALLELKSFLQTAKEEAAC